MQNTPNERTITATEAAKLLGLGRTTFYNFVKRHAIRPVPDNRPNIERPAKLLFYYRDIEPFIVPDAEQG